MRTITSYFKQILFSFATACLLGAGSFTPVSAQTAIAPAKLEALKKN